MRWGSGLLLFLLAGITACSGGVPGLPSTDSDDTASNARVPGAAFEILSRGAMPRQPLLQVFHVGAVETAMVELTAVQKTSIGDRVIPDVTLPMSRVRSSVTVNQLTTSGNAIIKVGTLTVEVLPVDGADPRIVAQQREVLGKRAGTSQQAEVTPQGEAVEYVRKFASTMEPEDVQELEQLDAAYRAVVFAFPPDALGEGAHWRVTKTISEAGITSVGTDTITLVRREGDRITTERTFEVRATVQGVDQPPAAGQQFRLRALTLTGKGTRIEDLQTLVPVLDTTDSTATLTFDLAGAPQPISAVRTKHVVTTRVP